MNTHYERYLYKKYQPLYREHTLPMSQTCMCWGMECGDGWFNILNALSYSLCEDWISAKYNYDQINGRVGELRSPNYKESNYNWRITEERILEAKERLNQEYAKVPVAVQVKEKFGSLRFYIHGGNDEQYALISFAERMSERTCEVCGKPGKINKIGWLSCRCKEHRNPNHG